MYYTAENLLNLVFEMMTNTVAIHVTFTWIRNILACGCTILNLWFPRNITTICQYPTNSRPRELFNIGYTYDTYDSTYQVGIFHKSFKKNIKGFNIMIGNMLQLKSIGCAVKSLQDITSTTPLIGFHHVSVAGWRPGFGLFE